jgi:hypothetical protein
MASYRQNNNSYRRLGNFLRGRWSGWRRRRCVLQDIYWRLNRCKDYAAISGQPYPVELTAHEINLLQRKLWRYRYGEWPWNRRAALDRRTATGQLVPARRVG